MLNALFGVAYGLETPFFPQLAAPNLAPKTDSYRTRTVYFIGSRKAEFGLGGWRIIISPMIPQGCGMHPAVVRNNSA